MVGKFERTGNSAPHVTAGTLIAKVRQIVTYLMLMNFSESRMLSNLEGISTVTGYSNRPPCEWWGRESVLRWLYPYESLRIAGLSGHPQDKSGSKIKAWLSLAPL
jgi:hypothetical protein